MNGLYLEFCFAISSHYNILEAAILKAEISGIGVLIWAANVSNLEVSISSSEMVTGK